MVVHRFMSAEEWRRLQAGQLLVNESKHRGFRSESRGFCFTTDDPKEAIHYLSGNVDTDVCVTMEVPEGTELTAEAVFGGRKLYYTEHGNYEIDDFWYAVNRNWLEGKENSWGYGDWRLFLQAKERLKELSAEDQPFNLTMLTLDTHFENGIRCKYCEIEYPGNSYADVYSCSSRQLSEFISWCQDQSYDHGFRFL